MGTDRPPLSGIPWKDPLKEALGRGTLLTAVSKFKPKPGNAEQSCFLQTEYEVSAWHGELNSMFSFFCHQVH